MRSIFFTILGLFLLTFSYGRQIVGLASGNWGDASVWSQTPTCADTITIPAGLTITVNAQHTYLCSPPIKIVVAGTLQFVNGYKLSLPCGSQVEILVGGTLKKSSAGGGNSTLIEICGTTVWNAGDGTVNGYALLGTGPLPVSWLYLEAQRKEEFVAIQWTTASEYNNDYFSLEKSTDQYNFTTLAKIDGAGTSTVLHNYSYNDYTATDGIVYYRIRQTDFDGKQTYSKTVAVSGRNSTKFELMAVAGNDGQTLNIIFTEPSGASCSYTLFDLGGRILHAGEVEAGKGVLSRTVQAPALVRGGMYVLQLSNGTEADSKRFIVN